MEKEELKEWRKKSDNFEGSSEDRDRLFEEIEKFNNHTKWKKK